MLESSVYLENSGGGSASDGISEDGGRNSPRNRRPRDETSPLLEIRSDMELAFNDSNIQSPLWDEVSRKDEISSKNTKSHRFFELLELADAHFSPPRPPPYPKQIPQYDMESNPMGCTQDVNTPCLFNQDRNAEFMSISTSSSGKESEGSVQKKRKKRKKRKLADYFERLMEDALKKQEDLQNKFLEAIEKYEKDRLAREETWKAQEMARIRREQEYLARERRISAAKDAVVLDFLQKITQQTNLQLDVPKILNPSLFEEPTEKSDSVMEKHTGYLQENTCTEIQSKCAAGKNVSVQTSSSRWPNEETETLIVVKTDLDLKCQSNGTKGPQWDDVSSCMKILGYERSAKKCKEKWGNINKYYKRIKGNEKIRPDDSKTCSYFSMLESIDAEKSKEPLLDSDNGDCNLKPEQILMQMTVQTKKKMQR